MRIMHTSRTVRQLTKFLMPVLEQQRKMGHYVCTCAAYGPKVEELRRGGFDVFINGLDRSLNPWNLLKSTLRIKRILRKHNIEVIICHTTIGAGVGRIAAWLAKTPRVIYFSHGLACAPAQSFFFMVVSILCRKNTGPFYRCYSGNEQL